MRRKITKKITDDPLRNKIIQDWILLKELVVATDKDVIGGISYDNIKNRRKFRSTATVLMSMMKSLKKDSLKLENQIKEKKRRKNKKKVDENN